MADFVDVYLAGLHIGTLAKTRKGARFAYDEKVASSFQGRPVLSFALPLNQNLTTKALQAHASECIKKIALRP